MTPISLAKTSSSPNTQTRSLLPAAHQGLTTSRGDPNVGVLYTAIRDERSRHSTCKRNHGNDGVGSWIGEPDVVTEFGHGGGHAGVDLSGGHVAAGGPGSKR